MADDPAKPLKDLKPEKDYFIGIDSDGCVFDTMAVKQRTCFAPKMIEYFKLEPVAAAARECKDFADLFSRTRGINRHKALRHIIGELLPAHPAVKEAGFEVPQPKHYFAWVDDEKSTLSNDGLKAAAEAASDAAAKAELANALAWSEEVNRQVKEKVKTMPPFAGVKEFLEKARAKADLIVVSQTPCEALEREWQESGLAELVRLIAGQEMGTKTQHLEMATKGKYGGGKVLMIGDAPGDMTAAKANEALFYPVLPGKEARSWQRLLDEGLDRFFSGRYAGEYEDKLVAEFDASLPENPPWA